MTGDKMDTRDFCARDMTREEALDRTVRAEEAMKHLTFVLSDLHGEATRLADERVLLKRQLRACGELAREGGMSSANFAYNTSESSAVRELVNERDDLRGQLAKLREASAPKPTPEPIHPASKFKKGDQVKVLGVDREHRNSIGTVLSTGGYPGNRVGVLFNAPPDNDHPHFFDESQLALLPTVTGTEPPA
jgi:hypothetical protein